MSLVRAKSRDRTMRIEVLADEKYTNGGKCKGQWAALQQLYTAGCDIRLTSGLKGALFGGIQHSKTVCVDCVSEEGPNVAGIFLVGSCNWARASLGNLETSVRVALNELGYNEARTLFNQRFETAMNFKKEASASSS